MGEKRCDHDFLPGQCSTCKTPPTGIKEVVYITKYSQAFHNDPKCSFLESGQDFAERRGGIKQNLMVRRWDQVFNSLGPCEWCCALYHSDQLSPKKRCLATIEGKQILVRYLRERFVDFGYKEVQVYDEVNNQIYFIELNKIQFL